MKTRIKNLITTILGLLMMLGSCFLIYEQYPEKYIYIGFGLGLLLVFSKDTLIKKLLGKI